MKMRRYRITDSETKQEAVVSLLRLSEATDFSPEEFDAVASLQPGSTFILSETVEIVRVDLSA